MRIDLMARLVTVKDIPITLTRKECELLIYFIANKGKVIYRTAIAQHLWGEEMDMYNNT